MIFLESDNDSDGNSDDYDEDDYYENSFDWDDGYSNTDDDSEASVKPGPPEEELNHMKRCLAICAKLNEERKECVLCDATIVVEGKKFPVHKTILTASSTYFSAMFTGSFSETNEEQIEINGVSAEVFEKILDYMYGAAIKLERNNIKEVFLAADMFCVDPLIAECKTFIRTYWDTMNDVHTVYELAGIFQMNDIAEMMLHRARIDLATFMSERDFRELPYSFLVTVLEGRSAIWHLMNESTMANYILKWVIFKPEERIPEIASKVFSAICFEFISEEEFAVLIELIRIEEITVKCELLASLKDSLKDMYRKSHQRLVDQKFMLVVLENSLSENIHIFNCESWKWETISYTVSKSPESYALNGSDLYTFHVKGCSRLNLESKEYVDFPEFPESRKKSVFSVVGKSIYVIGGVGETTNKPMGDILDLKPNKKSWHRGIWNGIWKKAKCKASSITYEQNIYLVGGRNSLNKSRYRSKCFVYNCENRKLKKICELSIPVCQPHLAIYDGVLYVISTQHLFTKIEGIDLKHQQLLPTSNKKNTGFYYPILSVCSVDEGLVIAYLCKQKILLVLFRPTGQQETEMLGYVPKPSVWPNDKPFLDFKLLFYKQK